jgi:hypothetical protein
MPASLKPEEYLLLVILSVQYSECKIVWVRIMKQEEEKEEGRKEEEKE